MTEAPAATPIPPVIPPRLAPNTGFTRELTPTWLATATLLAGRRPPDLDRPFRLAYLGAGHGATAAVVAAVHPDASVWAWDHHPDAVEAARRLRDDAGLANLHLHEAPGLPADLGGDRADLVVVDGLLASVDDDLRARIAAAIGASLRPGGLVGVAYSTLAGWSEITPVVALLRHRSARSVREPEELVPELLDLLVRLRDGGATYLTERPVVAAWLAELCTLAPAEIAACYLRDPLRPLSPAEVSELLAPTGCRYAGSARLADDLAGLPAALAEQVAGAPGTALQETFRDVATRPAYRVDLFRLGDARLDPSEWAARVNDLELTAIPPDHDTAPLCDPPGPGLLDDATWDRLRTAVVRAGDLAEGPERAAQIVRRLLAAGRAHPAVPGGVPDGAGAACAILGEALARIGGSASAANLIPAPLVGSAVPRPRARKGRARDRALLTRLGVG